MPENKTDEKTDVVSMEEHNKIVGVANTTKAENEQLKKELEELKNKDEVKETVETEKEEWKKAMEEQKKEIEELKTKVTEKTGDTKVAKGIVPGQQPDPNKNTAFDTDKFKNDLDEQIPTDQVKDVSNLSPIHRYGYYKSPTRAYSDDMLGKALSLDAGRHWSGQAEVGKYAKKNRDDIVVYANTKVL